MSNHPISDEVFRYHFENIRTSKSVDWTSPGCTVSHLDKTTEAYERLILFSEALTPEEKTILSTLQGYCMAFNDLPHHLEILELHPHLCGIENIMRATYRKLHEPVPSTATGGALS